MEFFACRSGAFGNSPQASSGGLRKVFVGRYTSGRKPFFFLAFAFGLQMPGALFSPDSETWAQAPEDTATDKLAAPEPLSAIPDTAGISAHSGEPHDPAAALQEPEARPAEEDAAMVIEADHREALSLKRALEMPALGFIGAGEDEKKRALTWVEHYAKLRKTKKARSFRNYCEQTADDAACAFREQDLPTYPEWMAVYGEQLSASMPVYLKRDVPRNKKQDRPYFQSILQIIANGDFSRLAGIPNEEIIRAGAHIDSRQMASTIHSSVMLQDACLPAGFYLSVGLKAEEWLPDPTVRPLITSMYEKSLSCRGLSPEQEARARFRVSLFYLWDQGCASATPHLERLSTLSDGDYSARGLYWLSRCAEKTGLKGAERTAYETHLRKLSPLSFQLLLLEKSKAKAASSEGAPASFAPKEWSDYLKRETALTIETRTDSNNVNWVILLAETAVVKHEPEVAREMLRMIDRTKLNVPGKVRLYLSTLAYHMGDHFNQFRMVDGAFKADPSMIALESLKLLFPLKYADLIQKYKNGLEAFFVAGLIRQESGFFPFARSPVGARGLMQLMPATAWITGRVPKAKLFQPEPNIKVGAKYLAQLADRFNGDLELALASYNAGPLRVEEWLRRYQTQDRVLFLDLIPFLETRKYVSLINRNFYWYTQLYGEGGFQAFKEASRGLASLR